MTTRTLRWAQRLGIAGLTAGLVFAPLTAYAATVDLEYDAEGSTHIASTDSTVQLGPTTLTTNLDTSTGEFTGSLPLPGTTSEFEVIGFVPVKARVDFIEAEPIHGTITFGGTNAVVTSTAKYYVKLSDIQIAGFPTFTGDHCRTKEPVTISADTPEGEGFELLDGGRLVGGYTIGEFEHCGLNTWLVNILVPGPGNTVDIQVSNGRLVS